MSQGAPGKRRSKYTRRPRGIQPILVDAAMANRILRGAKTQHRYGSDKPCRYRVHDLVPVHRKDAGKDADPLVCHVTVTQVYNQLPGDITDIEAEAEGYTDRKDFHAARSFRCRQAWVLTFEVAETQWMLHENPGMARSDYTVIDADAMRDEFPAPSAEVVRDFARHNNRRHADLKRAEREGLPLHVRVADLERAAKAGDGQAQRQLFVIQQRVEAHERRGDKAA